MEIFWLVVAIVTAVMAAYVIRSAGLEVGWQWLLLPAIATAMWAFRRFTRRRMAAWEERQKQVAKD